MARLRELKSSTVGLKTSSSVWSRRSRISTRRFERSAGRRLPPQGLQHKLEHQRRMKELTAARNQRRKDLFIAQDEVEARREA